MVLAIVSVLVGLLLPKGFDALRTARIQQVQKLSDTLKTVLTDFLAMPGGNGSLPRTEGTGIPCSGATLTGATDAAKGNGARLDSVLLTAGKLERPIGIRMGSQAAAPTGTGNEMIWNQAAQAFVMSPDAAPLKNWSLVTRVEARAATPLTAPSLAQGGNFRLDGVTNVNANYTVAYLVIPGCAAGDAYNLALAMNGAQFAPTEGAASDNGIVAYAAPVNGLTDVYVFLTAI